MSWTVRICTRPSVPGYGYAYHDVHFNEEGDITSYTNQPTSLSFEEKDDIPIMISALWDAYVMLPNVINLDVLDRQLSRRTNT